MLKGVLLLIIVVIFICAFSNSPNEGFGSGSTTANALSNEAIQNIASVYNTSDMRITNLTTTSGLSHEGTDFRIGTGTSDRGNCGACRALVHDGGNALTINYGGDFAGGTKITNNANITGNLIVNDIISSNRLYAKGGKKDGVENGGGTHFPFADDKNYIRGDTQADGHWTMNGNMSLNGNLTINSLTMGGLTTRHGRLVRYKGQFDYQGGDISGKEGFSVSGADDCVNQCAQVEKAISAIYTTNNKCWCKSHIAGTRDDANCRAYILI